jgi:pimeloyl-ACP methyl ester carboxylesterase
MKQSRSEFINIRGLRYHVRCWGSESAPKLFMMHGLLDVSASFQFLVDELRRDWHVIAPDWRGFGLTQWSGRDSYWFPDYLADLDVLLEALQPGEPANLVGHSMGANVTCMYAGIRPERVRRVVNLDNYGLRATQPQEAPARYQRWLGELETRPSFRRYASFAELADRMRRENPLLTAERATFLAPHWGRLNDTGQVELAADPIHRFVNPVLFRVEESKACWKRITAPVLAIEAGQTHIRKSLGLSDEELVARKACFANLRVEVIPEATHMLHHEFPEKLAGWIEPFLLD